MKTIFYLNGKKTTRKALTEMLGADRLKRYIEEAKETFFEDPLTQNSFWLGGRNMLNRMPLFWNHWIRLLQMADRK